jgi:ketosteroid isomerase-like protein
MIRIRTLALASTAAAGLFAVAAGHDAGLFASGSAAVQASKPGEGFQAMLTAVDATQVELQNGRPDAFKALWSRRDDITLSGGFGGTIEKGWDAIGRRLDWVGTQFSKGSNTIERLVAQESGDLAYVVQLEHLRYTVPGEAKESTRDYRVTMVFRRQSGAWRIVHRQADSQMTKQGAR